MLDESEKKAHNCEDLKDLIAKIGGVALEAEYDIEAELLEIRHQMLDVTLRRLLKDVEDLIGMIEARTAKVLQPQHPEENGNRWLSLKIVSKGSLYLTALEKFRSILCFGLRNWDAFSSLMKPNSFKMLRVLDLTASSENNGSIPSVIIDVVLLRYLALSSSRLLTSIPVSRNRNLQTLVIREDINGFRKLPHGIWELPQLRHLQLYHQLIPMYTPEVAQSVFLEARSLCIIHGNDPKYWRWTRDSGHEIAILRYVCWLEITGKLDARRLHKITSYSAYLIFKLKEESPELNTTFTMVRYINDKRCSSENRLCQVFLTEKSSSKDPDRFSNRRDDGWMEIRLGDFYISSTNEGEVEMQFWNITSHWKYDLIVKGIEVRPI
nr:putative late blight resistance protein homolog R1A-3 isoform X2 [Ipomoea batatas]